MNQTTTAAGSPFLLANTWTQALAGKNGNYRISVAVPSQNAPEQGFPVLYLLDANAGFATVVETHRRLSRRPDATRVGPAIIVGIGHETDALYDSALRQRDFGDPVGAAGLLEFIQDSVKPLIHQHAPVNQNHQILAGHSLAGFFTLWVLRHHPETFQRYVALSPSLWSDPSLLSGLAAQHFKPVLPHVFLAAGEWEEELAPWQLGQPGSEEILVRRRQRGMISHVKTLGEMLERQLGSERSHCSIFPEEDHASIFAIGMSRAMRMMLRPDT